MSEKKEPLFHIVKRDGVAFWQAALARVCGIFVALVLCAIFINAITGLNPVAVYASMLDGAFGTPRRIWNTVNDTMILLCVALAITPAFKMRFWNIGAEGQILIGGVATAAVMRACGDSLPTVALFALMLVCSLIAGMAWGFFPAWFKAKWNTNETLFTLMMNYIAIQVVSYLSIKWEAVKGSGTIGVINQDTKAGWINTKLLPDVFGNFNYSINTVIVLLVTLFIYLYLRYSKHGYEIAVVGESENTARYAGIKVGKVVIRTMALSGALCGLVGFILVAGCSHTITTATAGGDGFTAIVVSWLAKFNPIGMMGISFLLSFLSRGASQIASDFGLNESASDIITGIILFCILGSEFFLNYRVMVRSKQKEAGK